MTLNEAIAFGIETVRKNGWKRPEAHLVIRPNRLTWLFYQCLGSMPSPMRVSQFNFDKDVWVEFKYDEVVQQERLRRETVRSAPVGGGKVKDHPGVNAQDMALSEGVVAE